MESQSSRLLISENIGQVSYLVSSPADVKAIIVLAHGAGAPMTHRFMETLAAELYSRKIGTIRYNFPYMEKGGKRPDVPAVAEKTVNVISTYARKTFPTTPIFLGGKSFGGRMSSQYASKINPEGVKGIIFYGFPLHAPGAPSTDRAEHLKDIHIPMLFLQGTRDALAKLELIEKVCASLPQASLVRFEGADHSFKVKKAELTSELAASTLEWMEKIHWGQ